MKNFLIVIAIAIGMYSCDALQGVDVDTTLSKEFVIHVQEFTGKSSHLFNTMDTIHFNVSDTLSLNDQDIEEYVDRIRDIVVNNVKYQITLEPNDVEILDLVISIMGTDFIFTANNITTSTNIEDIGIDDSVILTIGNYLMEHKMLVLVIEGNTNKYPATVTVKLDFETVLTVDPI